MSSKHLINAAVIGGAAVYASEKAMGMDFYKKEASASTQFAYRLLAGGVGAFAAAFLMHHLTGSSSAG